MPEHSIAKSHKSMKPHIYTFNQQIFREYAVIVI